MYMIDSWNLFKEIFPTIGQKFLKIPLTIYNGPKTLSFIDKNCYKMTLLTQILRPNMARKKLCQLNIPTHFVSKYTTRDVRDSGEKLPLLHRKLL